MYIITFECGCKMPHSKTIKHHKTIACPTHKISKKKEIIFKCDICGIETNTTEHGNPIRQVGIRYVCYDCRIKIFPLLRKGIHIKQVIEEKLYCSLEKEQQYKKRIKEVSKQKDIWCDRKPDCKFYDNCLNKALKENEKIKDLPCIGCKKYEHVDIFDVMDFVYAVNDFSYPAIV